MFLPSLFVITATAFLPPADVIAGFVDVCNEIRNKYQGQADDLLEQGRIQDFLKGVTWVRRRRTCEHPLCAQRIKGASPVELYFCKVALRRRNLRASQSPFLALKHFARVVYQFSDRNNCAPVVFELP